MQRAIVRSVHAAARVSILTGSAEPVLPCASQTVRALAWFQSSPAPRAGATLRGRLHAGTAGMVSILTGSAEPVLHVRRRHCRCVDWLFQSSPAPRAGATCAVSAHDQAPRRRFQSSPAPRAGATGMRSAMQARRSCFNPHRLREPVLRCRRVHDASGSTACFNPHRLREPVLPPCCRVERSLGLVSILTGSGAGATAGAALPSSTADVFQSSPALESRCYMRHVPRRSAPATVSILTGSASRCYAAMSAS